ncbi:MAG: gliding motility-associated C-terminal domain-containing protein [Bacteroidota bacterium]
MIKSSRISVFVFAFFSMLMANTFISYSQTVSTDPVIGSPFCPCANVNVGFTNTGVFNAGNNYNAELSDAAGSFAVPVVIGTLNSSLNTGIISCVIPCNAVAGTFYRIRVTADNPVTVGTDNGIDLEILQSVVDSVNISANQTVICAGQQIDFTAIPTNGGTTPVYQWMVNGGNVGTNSTTYSSITLLNGDVVTCEMTSNAACVTGSPDLSNAIPITVSSNVPASVSVFANITTICAGGQIDFTATPTNGGVTPSYQWQVNGGNVGTNQDTYSTTTLNNGDVVTCIMTSNLACATGSPATSNSISVTVNPIAPAGVTISASTTVICSGQQIDFTAVPSNGGAAPNYQWQVNGTNAGTNSTTFSTTTLNNGDIVSCIMTSSNLCSTGNPATSNSIIVTVTPSVVESITITGNPTTICAGDPVLFSSVITNGGTTPVYQWQVNGANVGGNTSNFNSATLNNNDVVTCILTSNAGCVSNSPDTSNTVTITVTNGLVASVSIIANDSSVCAGTQVDFTATAVNGGATPTFQWQVNSVNVGTNSSSFSSTTLNNGDVVTCIMTSSSSCVSGSPATSTQILITVTPALIASVQIFASTTTICEGDQIDFTATPTNGGTAPTYQWQVNGVNVGTNSPNYSSTTWSDNDVITCVMTSNALCTTGSPASSNQITISVTPISTVTVSISAASAALCEGETGIFTALPANEGSLPVYQWFVNGNPVGTGSSYSSLFNDGDVVTCSLVSNKPCVLGNPASSNAVTITIQPNLTVTVAQDTFNTCWIKPVTLSASGANSYVWSTASVDPHLSCADCPNPIADPTDTTIYIVTGTTGSCTGSDTVVVNIHCPDVFVPNAFTPNNDHANEKFKVYALPMTEFTLMVWDRWGEMVFVTHDQNEGWDGSFHNKLCETGVYVWYFRGKDRDGKYVSISRTNSGDVTLFR